MRAPVPYQLTAYSLSLPHSHRGVQRPGAGPDSQKISWKNINTIFRHTRARCVRRHAPKATDTDTHCVAGDCVAASLCEGIMPSLSRRKQPRRSAAAGRRCCVSEASSCCLPRNVVSGYSSYSFKRSFANISQSQRRPLLVEVPISYDLCVCLCPWVSIVS